MIITSGLSIDKKRIVKPIDELPENATGEEAIERLVLLHKIQTGLKNEEKKLKKK